MIINNYECMMMKANLKNKVCCFTDFYIQWHEPHEIEFLVSAFPHRAVIIFVCKTEVKEIYGFSFGHEL
jgi:hypothetical protein